MGLMDRLKQTIGNEKVGVIAGRPEPKANKTKKTKGNKKEKKSLSSQSIKKDTLEELAFNSEKSLIDGEEHAEKYIKTDTVGGRSRRMILDALQIRTGEIIPNDLVTPEQIENTEFTISVPSGLDSDEVARFCDNMEEAVRQYRTALLGAYEDREKLIEEIVRTEQIVVESRNQAELNAVLNGSNDEREALSEKLIAAQSERLALESENIQLKRKLSNAIQEPSVSNEDLMKLKSENEALLREMDIMRETSSTQASTDNTEDLDTLHRELEEYSERNDQLSKEVTDLREKLATQEDPTPNDEAESLRKQIATLQSENALLKSTQKVEVKDDTGQQDNERAIMEKFMAKQSVNKGQPTHPTKLTIEEIAKIKEVNSTGDIRINGINDQEEEEDESDPFTAMLKDLNRD